MTVYGIAYVDAEGHIDSFYIPGPTGYPEEGTSEADNTKTIVHVTDEVTDMSSFVKYSDCSCNYNSIITRKFLV